MKPLIIKLLLLTAALLAAPAVQAGDWMYLRSAYTHDSNTGERVTQYQQPTRVFIVPRPDYLQSGYRHNHIQIGRGPGADNIHIIEEWGRRVRPYGEWRYPYRPYSVPYRQWGPPYGGLGNGYGTYGGRGGYQRDYRGGDVRGGQFQQGHGHQHGPQHSGGGHGGRSPAAQMPTGPV